MRKKNAALLLNYVSCDEHRTDLEKTADNADAAFGCATRRCLRYAQTCFATALALLFDLENNVGSSKAAAKQVAEGDSDELRGRQPTSALSAFFFSPGFEALETDSYSI